MNYAQQPVLIFYVSSFLSVRKYSNPTSAQLGIRKISQCDKIARWNGNRKKYRRRLMSISGDERECTQLRKYDIRNSMSFCPYASSVLTEIRTILVLSGSGREELLEYAVQCFSELDSV